MTYTEMFIEGLFIIASNVEKRLLTLFDPVNGQILWYIYMIKLFSNKPNKLLYAKSLRSPKYEF